MIKITQNREITELNFSFPRFIDGFLFYIIMITSNKDKQRNTITTRILRSQARKTKRVRNKMHIVNVNARLNGEMFVKPLFTEKYLRNKKI